MTKAIRPATISCARCGTEKPVSRGGPIPTYCSAACRAAANYESSRQDGRYDEARAAQRLATAARQSTSARPCPYCGDLMTHLRRVQCGRPDCKRAFDAERARQWHRDYTADTGARYSSKYRERELAYSRRRYEEQPHWRIKYPERGPLVDARRRMLMNQAVKGEPFAAIQVYERDGWMCLLCRTPMDPAIAWPHRMSPSVDHVIALSRGGEHTLDNVQAAHLGCNSSKGDATVEA